jgi:hypothetical protein
MGFVFNPDSIAVLGRAPETKDMLMVYAARVREAAEHEAEPLGHRNPDAEDLGYTGPAYKDAFGITFRAFEAVFAAIVYNVAYDATWVEVGAHPGGSGTPALGYHVLQHALDEGMA